LKIGHASPDWPVTGRPAQCRLDDADSAGLRRSRREPVGAAVFTWRGGYRTTGWLAA
jgi:hypothetical protein